MWVGNARCSMSYITPQVYHWLGNLSMLILHRNETYLLESIGPIHTSCVLSQRQPAATRSSATCRRGQPAAMRSAVSGQLRILLKASTPSTLHAPTAQAA